jgi:hypothetical protein
LSEGAADLLAALLAESADLAAQYPGGSGARQPVHTVYGGAHLVRSGLARRMGELALAALEEYAPNPEALAEAFAIPPALAERVWPRVEEKLRREAVEDYRIDFEDGYGTRPDTEEDAHAVAAARRRRARGRHRRFRRHPHQPFSAELAASLRTPLALALCEATGRLHSW